jgi:hypothetical protein
VQYGEGPRGEPAGPCLVHLVYSVCLVIGLNERTQMNQINQINQINKTNQINQTNQTRSGRPF